MGNRLNVSDGSTKRAIEEKYLVKVEKAEEEAKAASSKLRKKIEDYRSKGMIDVSLEIEEKARKKYEFLNSARNSDELTIAIYTVLLDERGQVEVSDEVCKAIDGILAGLSKEQNEAMLSHYKKQVINKLVAIQTEKEEKEYILFRLMDDEDIEEYITKYERAYLAGCLLKARRSSIKSTSSELGAELPKCIKYEEQVEEKTTKIVKREKQNIKDFSIKKRIKENFSGVIRTIEDHAPNLARAILASNVSGFLLAALANNNGATKPEVLSLYAVAGPIIFAIMSSVICSKEIKQYLEDKSVIDDAKKSGLYDLALAYDKACSDLTSFEESVKNKARIHGTGRIM